ncbi:hypothetical protein PN466_13475 [Roseofilum reptotaenium CS-1145]|uniref:Uncharacterized protein n=1 Tax=Roseofilum reptotaenium AO1-A TaxID=1925591 RepID=A0A1L9QW94_9CYAN|nr:hypothetical protein [Roseofilum reptotaenium]MDB9517959.1 hypothetical protein [Roseofilum reptotaenium CS-1145]OJJ26950.1 hypothetical protein BI308_04485 [Roseofilum reptotaenium AO1-A]
MLREQLVLYGIAGESVSTDNIVIIPAYYELFVSFNRDALKFDFSLRSYMDENGYNMSEICHTFYQFSKNYLDILDASCDAIWVRAKIPSAFRYLSPSKIDCRYNLLDIPFLAVILDDPRGFPSLHPFTCIEEDLQAGLEFYPTTPYKQGLRIANVFWKLLLEHQGLTDFMDDVLGDHYDDYESVVMGSNFTTGYQWKEFYLETYS